MYESSGIVPRAASALKAELGKLNPEDFFEIDDKGVPKRIQYQTKAKDKLNVELKPYGLEVKDVLIRYPKYHDAVQQRFENKTEQDQLFFTEQSEARLAQEKALLKKLQVEGSQAANVRKSEGDAYFNTIEGQVQAYKTTKESEGDRLMREANAEGSRLINEAYRGEGSERLVGMKMAENLKNLDEIIVTTCGEKGFNPLNLDKTMKQVSGKN
jgi:regulator of protease activity HflC (stomatin/prohibitin superfamily)